MQRVYLPYPNNLSIAIFFQAFHHDRTPLPIVAKNKRSSASLRTSHSNAFLPGCLHSNVSDVDYRNYLAGFNELTVRTVPV